MSVFSNEDYELMIGELIQDTFYVNLTNRGKIKGIRQFSEVIVRKILGIGSERKIMLGDLSKPARKGGAREELNCMPPARKEDLLKIVEKIRPQGNAATHTQHVESFSDDELEQVQDALFELYSFLFVDYFLKYPMTMDTRGEVYQDFSLLPPIIRYKTLKYLFDLGKTNIYVSDRYCLAMVKTFDKKFALDWLKENQEILSKDIYPNEQQLELMVKQNFEFLLKQNQPDLARWISTNGEEKVINEVYKAALKLTEQELEAQPFKNTYELCLHKINEVSDYINKKGKLYEDFEQAVSYYKSYRAKDTFSELQELHDIMEFVYLGRKDREIK